jgi:asparagine synthase (glutamine-hydrolysing)
MVAAMAHRGPDDHGATVLPNCILGNTRLAIVDLSQRGHQPMQNEDGSAWITYNGECYNAPDLRASLESRGHHFRSSTDTEVVLRLYEEDGEDFVQRLRGMFALAIWDAPARRLLLARDRLGIKPLYYSICSAGLLFASELKALVSSGLIPARLNHHAARAFLQLGHIPPPWGAIDGMSPLWPGEMATWQDGRWSTRRYWDVASVRVCEPLPKRSQTVCDLRDLLVESCRIQQMSDVPMALFLSGGTDSAAMGVLMRQTGAENLTALTIGFAEGEFDETESSRRTASLLALPHRVLRAAPEDFAGMLDGALLAMDQPTVDGFNSYAICRVAAEAGYKVALSGQGGDELFGGYASLNWFRRFYASASLLRVVPRTAANTMLDRPSLPYRYRKLAFLTGADDPFVASQLAVRTLFTGSDLDGLLVGKDPVPPIDEAREHIMALASATRGRGLLERIALMDVSAHLVPRLLRDADAMSMTHSLELRPVFLDHPLVEYVLGLPAEWRLDRKRLLLDAMDGLAPAELITELRARPKHTFTFPFARWLGGAWRSMLDVAFDSSRLRSCGVLQPQAAGEIWKRYKRAPGSVGWSRIWCLFILQRWCELMGVRP